MDSVALILVLCGLAFVALLLNRRKRLPKSVFVFFVVSIVCALCWHAMNSGAPAENERLPEKEKSTSVPVIFTETAKDVIIAPGETRIALPVLFSGKRSYDCVRFVIEADALDTTEQAFVDKVKFSLLLSDGTLLPAAGISIEKDGDFAFPRRFVLKVFFDASKAESASEMRCIVENGFASPLKFPEISVGARPVSSR